MRILMILNTGESAAKAAAPALRVEQVVGAYYVFRDRGIEIVLASPAGGSPWIGAASSDRDNKDLRRFNADWPARDALTDTIRLDQAYAEDFDAALCIGSPGSVWRAEGNNPAGALIADFLAAGKPVGVVASDLDLAPSGTGEGLLIAGSSAATPVLAAHALIGALGARARPSENG